MWSLLPEQIWNFNTEWEIVIIVSKQNIEKVVTIEKQNREPVLVATSCFLLGKKHLFNQWLPLIRNNWYLFVCGLVYFCVRWREYIRKVEQWLSVMLYWIVSKCRCMSLTFSNRVSSSLTSIWTTSISALQHKKCKQKLKVKGYQEQIHCNTYYPCKPELSISFDREKFHSSQKQTTIDCYFSQTQTLTSQQVQR